MNFLDVLSMLFIYAAAALLILILAKHFNGMKIPHFWAFFLGGFFLLTLGNFFDVSLSSYFSDFKSFVVLVANLLVFLGVVDLYRTAKKK